MPRLVRRRSWTSNRAIFGDSYMIHGSWVSQYFSSWRGLHRRTFRSSCKSCDFSITSDSTGLHFDVSLTKAKICLGVDLWPLELKTLDFNEPA